MGAEAVSILWGKSRLSLLSLKEWDPQRPGSTQRQGSPMGFRTDCEVSCLGP